MVSNQKENINRKYGNNIYGNNSNRNNSIKIYLTKKNPEQFQNITLTRWNFSKYFLTHKIMKTLSIKTWLMYGNSILK